MIHSDESKLQKQNDEDISPKYNMTKPQTTKKKNNKNTNDIIININNNTMQPSHIGISNLNYQSSPFIENQMKTGGDYQMEQYYNTKTNSSGNEQCIQLFNNNNVNMSNQKQSSNLKKNNTNFLNVNYTPIIKPTTSLNPNTMIYSSPMIDGRVMNQHQQYMNGYNQILLSPITDLNYSSTPNINNFQTMNFSPNIAANTINHQQQHHQHQTNIANDNFCFRTPKQSSFYSQHLQNIHRDNNKNSTFNTINSSSSQHNPNFISSLTPNISNTTQQNNNNRMYMLSPYHDPSTMTPNTNHFNIMNINIQPNSNQHPNHQQITHSHYNNSVFSGNSINPSTTVIDEALLDNMLTKQSKNKKSKKPKQQQSLLTCNNPNDINPSSPIKLRNKATPSTFILQPHLDNEIYIDSILLYKDPRTTLMIKNIPNKYTIGTFLDEINVEFRNKYDIFYLPIDYGNKCNLGFAFINFVEPMHIIHFYELYRGKRWRRFNSEKICELVYAKIQGKKELISHFEKGKVLQFDSEEKRPLILPTPNPLPQVKVPIKMFDKFIQAFPYAKYGFEKGEGINSQMDFFTLDNFYPSC